MKQTIEALVEGGNASPGPPLGPALGPTGVKIPDVIAEINEKTKDMAGMKVPVKVIVDTEKKTFEIEVGTPPVSALILKELNLEKGAKEPGRESVGNLTEEQVRKIARIKFGSDDEAFVNQVKGSARSMGITVGASDVTEKERECEKSEEEIRTGEETEEGEKSE